MAAVALARSGAARLPLPRFCAAPPPSPRAAAASLLPPPACAPPRPQWLAHVAPLVALPAAAVALPTPSRAGAALPLQPQDAAARLQLRVVAVPLRPPALIVSLRLRCVVSLVPRRRRVAAPPQPRAAFVDRRRP